MTKPHGRLNNMERKLNGAKGGPCLLQHHQQFVLEVHLDR